MKKKWDTILNLLISILSVGSIAILSTIFVNTKSNWYLSLNLPKIYPPRIVFAIVWSVIYVLFAGIIFYLLQKEKLSDKSLVGTLLGSGILNVLWTFSFFYLNNIFLILGIIIITVIFAVWLSANLFKANKVCGYLSIIYVIWLLFATILNLLIFTMN